MLILTQKAVAPKRLALALALLFAASAATAAPVTVAPVTAPPATAKALPLHIGGRVATVKTPTGVSYRRQWPGGYFETRATGPVAYFRVGAGEVALDVSVDGARAARLVKPHPGAYRISGLTPGHHDLRVDITSESQAGPTGFGGFFAPQGETGQAPPARAHQIEFIGDSHTVGYGDTSPTRTCTEDQVWSRTDTSQSFGPLTASHYRADYQINAISGRGIVRNYNGGAGDTLPIAYPYTLFDKQARYYSPVWHPQVIVIALGTNDFSTPLNPDEKWKTRAQLHADYEATYVKFVDDLRAANPHAFFILWATDMANGEIEAETGKVVNTLRAAGDTRIAYLPIDGLAFSACNSHPSLADHRTIAAALEKMIDAHKKIWAGE